MKRMLRSAGVLLAISALLTPAAQAYYTVTGNGTAPATYNKPPQTSKFYKPTGDNFVGLAGGGGNFALSYFNYRTTPNAAPALTALGSDASITNLAVGQLTACPYSGAANGVTTPTIVAYMTAANTLNAVTKANQTAAITGTVFDAAAAATAGVQALASGTLPGTTTDAVFAAVLANGGGNFGTAASGINGGILTQTNGAAGITLYNMTNGTAVAGDHGTAIAADFTVAAAGNNNWNRMAPATTVSPSVDMWYDPLIGTSSGGTLYVAAQIQSGAAAAGEAAIGLGIYHVTAAAPSFSLTQTGIILPAAADNGHIFYSVSDGASAGNVTLYKVRTMHTSTGLSYVVLAGGAGIAGGTPTGAPGTVENVVYAIPVVNGVGTSADGLPAKVTAFSSTAGYTTVANPATAATELYTTITPAVQVGNGVLPVSNGVGHQVSDMYVDGDTVYVALNTATTALIEGGIYSSQACFNSLGQIDHWTDWRKVVPNDMGNTSDGADGRVAFCAVDSYTGHVFATSNATNNWTKVTQWTLPTGSPTTLPLLASAVNTALSNVCYSVCDLNSSTTSWGHTVVQRITAFGGEEKVCFAVTGSSSSASNAAVIALTTSTGIDDTGANDAYYNYANTSANLMFITTSLPAGAGAVVALGYSSWDAYNDGGGAGNHRDATAGFFFAGCAGTASTAPALYVFADATTGVGVNPKSFTGMGSNATLNTFTWQKLTNVSGMPMKIVSKGGAVHVLTRTASLDRVFSCAPQTTLAGLNTNFVVTASSATAPTPGSANSSLATALQIYDLVVSVSATASNTTPPTGNEQLLILANDGIYTTSSLVGMQSPTSQLNAGWVKIDGTSTVVTAGFFTDYVGQPNYDRNPQSFWFANFAPNAVNTSVYNRTKEYQMSRQAFTATGSNAAALGILANALTYTENPTATGTYNGSLNVGTYPQSTAPTIYKTFPVTARLFYDDGARRFFIQKNPSDDTRYQVLALPYDLTSYNITADGKTTMQDTAVAAAGSFYWIAEIGSTGQLMMGTSTGVISQE